MYDDFYIEPRKLNIKKVIFVSIISLIIITLLILGIAKKISTAELPKNEEIKETSTIFYSNDHSISVELSNTFGLKPYNTNLGYLLELRSPNNLNIFISQENILQNKNLSEVVEADKRAFLGKFEAHSNLSETKELSVNNNLGYTYSFHYLDKNLNKAFYLQVTWLQIENNYYVFDIEFPLDDLSFNTNISANVLSSFNQSSTK